MRSSIPPPRPLFVRLGVGVGLVALCGVLWGYLDFGVLERWLVALGPWGPVVFVLAFVVIAPALVPDTPLAAVAGALFGVVWGTALTMVAAALAAALMYALSRWLLRDWLQGILAEHPRLSAVEGVVARGQKRLLILLRLIPINPALFNYLLGATKIGFGRYLLSCIGLVPAYFVAAYVGWLARVSGDGAHTIGFSDYAATAGVAFTLVALFFAVRAARRTLGDLAPRPRDDPGE